MLSPAPPRGATPADAAARVHAFAKQPDSKLLDADAPGAQLAPDYVVCVAPNDPGPISATDGAATVLFACRGYAHASVETRTLKDVSSGKAPLVGACVGPVGDPIIALAKVWRGPRTRERERDGSGGGVAHQACLLPLRHHEEVAARRALGARTQRERTVWRRMRRSSRHHEGVTLGLNERWQCGT